MKITSTVSGARDTALRLDKADAAVMTRVRAVIEDETGSMFAAVQPPRGASGRLASQKRMAVTSGDNFVRGRVFIDAAGNEAAKAGALEYGAPGKRARSRRGVREHKRSLRHVWGRSISPIEVMVHRYNRTQRLAERRFLRGPLEARRGQIEQRLREAATGATRDLVKV